MSDHIYIAAAKYFFAHVTKLAAGQPKIADPAAYIKNALEKAGLSIEPLQGLHHGKNTLMAEYSMAEELRAMPLSRAGKEYRIGVLSKLADQLTALTGIEFTKHYTNTVSGSYDGNNSKGLAAPAANIHDNQAEIAEAVSECGQALANPPKQPTAIAGKPVDRAAIIRVGSRAT